MLREVWIELVRAFVCAIDAVRAVGGHIDDV